MSAPKDGGPAFSVQPFTTNSHEWSDGSEGMSLRDWFAGQALIGSVLEDDRAEEIGKDGQTFAQISAWRAYRFADAMLEAREGK